MSNSSKDNSGDTSDFLAFSEPGPQPQPADFTPHFYSSPSRSPFQGRGRHSYQKRGFNRSYGSPGQYNNRNKSWNNRQQNRSKEAGDISQYLHPSFTEDPWADLEAKLRNKTSFSKSEEVPDLGPE